MRRTIYLGVFILLSTIAGLLYYTASRQRWSQPVT